MKKLMVVFLAAALLLMAGCVMPLVMSVPATDSAATAAPSTELPTEPATEAPSTELPTELPTEPVTEAPPTTTEAPEPIDPWSVMGELSFEEGTYEDSSGNVYTYSYGLPCITDDTDGARAINANIDEVFGALIRDAHQAMDVKYSLYLIDTGYYGEVWEDVLTLVIIAHTDFGDDQYGIYPYEVSTGRWLGTQDLLERMGISEETFLDTCGAKFREYFLEQYKDISEEDREAFNFDEFLARVDDEQYVNMNLRIYPSESGELIVAAPIVSVAGADYYWHLLPLGIGG